MLSELGSMTQRMECTHLPSFEGMRLLLHISEFGTGPTIHLLHTRRKCGSANMLVRAGINENGTTLCHD